MVQVRAAAHADEAGQHAVHESRVIDEAGVEVAAQGRRVVQGEEGRAVFGRGLVQDEGLGRAPQRGGSGVDVGRFERADLHVREGQRIKRQDSTAAPGLSKRHVGKTPHRQGKRGQLPPPR
ncbi:hypothetical protein [Massilia phosphatilytica]